MNLRRKQNLGGSSTGEMMIVVGMTSVILAASFTASTALQKSFAAIDSYFSTHMQQIRIVDYLGRDVKRSTIVTTSVDRTTVTCTIPNYIIKAGDPDAGAGSVNVGKRRTPTIRMANGPVVDYGTSTSTIAYSLNNQSISRTEDGVVTIVASSTDKLVPDTTDVELANTEYAVSNVTFLPTFNFNKPSETQTEAEKLQEKDKRNGTAVYSVAYLRNKRRG